MHWFKKSFFCLITVLSVNPLASVSRSFIQPADTIEFKHYLDMKGRIMFGNKYLEKAFVRIYADTSLRVVQKMESDVEGWVAFQLPTQKQYTIKISKAGYVTKIITVDAHMLKSQETGDYYFEFAVDLFEEIAGMDVSILKNPIAKIFFNTFTKKFDYDYNYTAKINSDIKKLYESYAVLKNKKNGTMGVQSKKVEKKQRTRNNTKKIPDDYSATVIKTGSKVTFSIEVISSREQLQKNSPKFKGVLNVKEYKEENVYKYYVGEYQTQGQAEKIKDNISGHFPGAVIIVFKEGKKISMSEAQNSKEK